MFKHDGEDEDDEVIDPDLYCWTAKCGDKYYTMAISPLLQFLIRPSPIKIKAQIGEATFIAYTDQPVYLIPVDYEEEYEIEDGVILKKETIDLFLTKAPPMAEHMKSLVVPMEYSLGVEDYFYYKIEDGKLYEQKDDGWKLYQF